MRPLLALIALLTVAPLFAASPARRHQRRVRHVVRAGHGKRRRAPLVPLSVQHKLAALVGNSAYVPGWLPAGYRFVQWGRGEGSPFGASKRSVRYDGFEIDFAQHGWDNGLAWKVHPVYDAYDCQGADARETIGGRHVAYANGNHGQSGFWCFGPKGRRWQIETWDDHYFPPLVEMRMVASARLAR